MATLFINGSSYNWPAGPIDKLALKKAHPSIRPFLLDIRKREDGTSVNSLEASKQYDVVFDPAAKEPITLSYHNNTCTVFEGDTLNDIQDKLQLDACIVVDTDLNRKVNQVFFGRSYTILINEHRQPISADQEKAIDDGKEPNKENDVIVNNHRHEDNELEVITPSSISAFEKLQAEEEELEKEEKRTREKEKEKDVKERRQFISNQREITLKHEFSKARQQEMQNLLNEVQKMTDPLLLKLEESLNSVNNTFPRHLRDFEKVKSEMESCLANMWNIVKPPQ